MLGRRRVRAMAQDQIDENDANTILPQGLGERRVANRRLDHRMRSTAGILVRSKVDDDMAAIDRTCARYTWHGCVRRERYARRFTLQRLSQNDLRFGAKRAARQEAAHNASAAR